MAKSSSSYSKYILPLVSGIIFSVLFWVTTSFIYRDAKLVAYWSAGGFAVGALHGVILHALAARFTLLQKTSHKNIFFVGVLLVEFLVGVFFVGPFTWLQLRFTPNSNIHSICCETPKDYGATGYDNLRITTADNAHIAGWYVAPTTQAGKVIILIHGYGYDRRGTDFQTRILIAAGYGVLLYDLRDHGESSGAINSFNRMQVYAEDLQQVVRYLKQKPEVAQIGIVGISLGAFATLNSSAEILNSFSALWLDGLRFENFGALPANGAYIKRLFDQQTRWLAGFYSKQPIPPAPPVFAHIIPTITHPKLMLVSSGLDESERATNEKLIPLLGNKKELWIIDNAWHIGGRFDAPDEYRKRMLAFFEQAFNN